MFNWNQEDWLKSVKSRYLEELLSVISRPETWSQIKKEILRCIPPPTRVSEWDIKILSASYGQQLTKCIHEDSWDFVHNVKLQEDFESRKFVSRHTDLYSFGCQGL